MGMFDVADKPDTLRTAVAQATVIVNPETIRMVRDGKSPKGDIVEAARVAATMAAKKTSDLIPYCHPIPLDYIHITVTLNEASIEIQAVVKTIWKTGVEVEALTAVSIAALTVYDMLKPIDKTLCIESIKLLSKTGGIKGVQEPYSRQLKAAVLVVSDSVSRGEREDKSGKLAVEVLQKYGFTVDSYGFVPDDVGKIEAEFKRFCDDLKLDLVVSCGGTGIGPRDVTTEATLRVVDREIGGVSEALRAYGQRRTPMAMLSRGVSGVRCRTVIVNLPGSPKAVSEGLAALFPGILHVYAMLEGQGH
ncbi:MAG: bifunctional molybdenum cofactor biosynthesis protein MoaC/MoaB [Nitrososphaerota archaeon]|jgi:molybdenum cofactor biosynthesis protein MoaC|nr:bifunctional molybdenum cofactor biosynthesis protein MoaC/MoaB [Nitrososphaerota archaeon]